METNMGQQTYDCFEPGSTARATLQWIAEVNIANFEQQLKFETDTCQRKLLQGLLVLEREKLKTLKLSER
jgi:hypothetical protein